jgi:hypothetical protein
MNTPTPLLEAQKQAPNQALNTDLAIALAAILQVAFETVESHRPSKETP